jgi:acetolactate synthase-1/2/3 large subunit
MYTIQSLWTMARENLDVTVMIFANGSYNILRGELTNVGVKNPGPRAVDMLTLNRPDLGWVAMARGMGVDGQRVTDNGELLKALTQGLAVKGPYLIEVAI